MENEKHEMTDLRIKLRLNFTRDLSLDELSKIISSVIRQCNFPSRTSVHLVHHLSPDVGNPTKLVRQKYAMEYLISINSTFSVTKDASMTYK